MQYPSHPTVSTKGLAGGDSPRQGGRMEIAEHVEAVRREGGLLADAAERAGLGAAVPPCAPWQVKDLLRHTGYIHRWAARHLSERPERVIGGTGEAEILAGGAPDAELAGWFRAGHAALVRTLSTADPGLVPNATAYCTSGRPIPAATGPFSHARAAWCHTAAPPSGKRRAR